MPFADLGLSDELLRAVNESGYTEPTPIQAAAIPPVLMMRDLIGIAQTGTGKTASFVLPMIDILAHGRARALMPRSLILEPTRELAAQVAENFEKYGKYHKLSMALLIGGVQMGDQVKALEKGVDVLIATPGRLMDLFERGKILLTGCNLLVIDEADRMLDMGFIPDIETICTKLPKQRQTLLFSATMPPPIKKLADKFLDNPKTIEVARPASTNTNIAQRLVPVRSDRKRELLRRFLRAEAIHTAIIFCNRKTTVRELNKSLRGHGFASGEIHGDMDQPSRIAELDRFKRGDINILVASDVAARGLDIKGVSHVFNFDAPWHPDDYVHRIGRTGRAGASGSAFTFITPDDAENIANIEKLTGQKIERISAPEGETADDGDAHAAAERPPARRERGEREKRPARERSRRSGRAAQTPCADDTRADDTGADDMGAVARDAEPPRETRSEPQHEMPRARPAGRSSHGEPNLPPRRRDRRDRDDGPDEGWNGPVPAFLDVTLGR
jgi:superfamily II DNA/RNA helicase